MRLGASGETETHVVSFTFFQYEASSTVLYVKKAIVGGSRQTREESIAVVEAQQNE